MVKFKAKIQILNIIKESSLEGWSNVETGDIIEMILPLNSNICIVKNLNKYTTWKNPFDTINSVLSYNFDINQIK